MRGILSLILVVAFSGLAMSQQAFPNRLSESSDLSKPSQPKRLARQGYFGPLDGMGTEPIPVVEYPQRLTDHSTASNSLGNRSEVRAAQFSQQQEIQYLPAETPATSGYQGTSTTPGYRETPTRPVRATYYPNGLAYDETAFIRQDATNARECFDLSRCNTGPNHCKRLAGCADEWSGFCPCEDLDYECSCKQFPGPNFFREHRKCGTFFKNRTADKKDACGCEPEELRARARSNRRKLRSQTGPRHRPTCGCCGQSMPDTEPTCNGCGQTIPESLRYFGQLKDQQPPDAQTVEWTYVQMDRGASEPEQNIRTISAHMPIE